MWSNGTSPASWHFLTFDGATGEAIAAHEAMRRLELGPKSGKARGFGSVKVRVQVGASEWGSSVFPDKARGGYVLPVKAAVRRAEKLAEGDLVVVTLVLL